MLKAIFIDIFPFIIDKTKIYESIWKYVLGDEYESFLASESLNKFISLDLVKEKIQEEFIIKYENQEKAKQIIEEYTESKKQYIKKYFASFEFPEFFIKLAQDAKNEECSVVITNDNEYYQQAIKSMKLPENTSTCLQFGLKDIDNIEEIMAQKNISIDEFMYISNDESKIEQLVEKGLFCVKISEGDSDSSDVTILNSIDDLTFGNLAFRFYDWNNSQGGL